MIDCKICNKKCGSKNVLSYHVKMEHSLNYIDYLIKHENFKIPKCPICGKDCKYNHGNLFSSICGDKNCAMAHRKLLYKDETKEKIRQARFNYLKKKLGKTAWERRINGEMSYLEQWFFDNVIIKYSLLEKYDIVNEFPEYPYFIDFAFLNVRLAVELDGKQHFRNIKNQNRDIKKQALLIEKGWKVYRVRFDELKQEKIIDFLNVLNSVEKYETKILECRLYKFAEYKKSSQTREEYLKRKKQEYIEREKENILKIRNSNVDFTKHGWVVVVAKLINKKHQKIYNWMKNFCPDILERAHKSVKCLKSENNYVKIIKQKKAKIFHKMEKIAVEKGYHFDEFDNVINYKGKKLKASIDRGYYFFNIAYNSTIKHIKIHRFKAYHLYGDNIYKENSHICFKNGDKSDWSDNNIAIKE